MGRVNSMGFLMGLLWVSYGSLMGLLWLWYLGSSDGAPESVITYNITVDTSLNLPVYKYNSTHKSRNGAF